MQKQSVTTQRGVMATLILSPLAASDFLGSLSAPAVQLRTDFAARAGCAMELVYISSLQEYGRGLLSFTSSNTINTAGGVLDPSLLLDTLIDSSTISSGTNRLRRLRAAATAAVAAAAAAAAAQPRRLQDAAAIDGTASSELILPSGPSNPAGLAPGGLSVTLVAAVNDAPGAISQVTAPDALSDMTSGTLGAVAAAKGWPYPGNFTAAVVPGSVTAVTLTRKRTWWAYLSGLLAYALSFPLWAIAASAVGGCICLVLLPCLVVRRYLRARAARVAAAEKAALQPLEDEGAGAEASTPKKRKKKAAKTGSALFSPGSMSPASRARVAPALGRGEWAKEEAQQRPPRSGEEGSDGEELPARGSTQQRAAEAEAGQGHLLDEKTYEQEQRQLSGLHRHLKERQRTPGGADAARGTERSRSDSHTDPGHATDASASSRRASRVAMGLQEQVEEEGEGQEGEDTRVRNVGEEEEGEHWQQQRRTPASAARPSAMPSSSASRSKSTGALPAAASSLSAPLAKGGSAALRAGGAATLSAGKWAAPRRAGGGDAQDGEAGGRLVGPRAAAAAALRPARAPLGAAAMGSPPELNEEEGQRTAVRAQGVAKKAVEAVASGAFAQLRLKSGAGALAARKPPGGGRL